MKPADFVFSSGGARSGNGSHLWAPVKGNNMKKMMFVWMIAIAFAAASVRAGGLECAVDAALQGTLGTAIEWEGNTFKISPVTMADKDKRKHTLTGTLVCRNGKKKDQTVEYRISKTGGTVDKVELQIDGGMWIGLSPEMNKAVTNYRHGDAEQASKAALYKAGEGSWQRTAELIVAFIGIKHC